MHVHETFNTNCILYGNHASLMQVLDIWRWKSSVSFCPIWRSKRDHQIWWSLMRAIHEVEHFSDCVPSRINNKIRSFGVEGGSFLFGKIGILLLYAFSCLCCTSRGSDARLTILPVCWARFLPTGEVYCGAVAALKETAAMSVARSLKMTGVLEFWLVVSAIGVVGVLWNVWC